MASLYEINKEYSELWETSFESEDLEELELKFKENQNNYEDKVLNYIKYIRNLESDINSYKEEEKSLATKRKSTEKKIERLKEILKNSMEERGYQKLDLGIFKPYIKTSEKVDILNLILIPEEFLRLKAPEPKKDDIKKAIKNGIDIQGARIVENKSLVIK